MSQPDHRGSPALSFTPTVQSTKAWSRALGATLIIGALALSVWSVTEDRAAYPALAAGVSASGMLSGAITEADGDHATVTYMPRGTLLTATSIDPIEIPETGNGRSFTVYYDTRSTFIEGVDEVEVDWGRQGAAGAVGLIGLIMIARPFKVPCKQKRVRPQGRHRD